MVMHKINTVINDSKSITNEKSQIKIDIHFNCDKTIKKCISSKLV